MATSATLCTVTTNGHTYTLVDNDSTNDYQSCANPTRFTTTKDGVQSLKTFANVKQAMSHFGGQLLRSSESFNIGAQARKNPT